MIVIPAFLSIVAAVLILLAFAGVINVNGGTLDDENEHFQKTAGRVDRMAAVWSENAGIDAIKNDINEFNFKNNGRGIYLLLYDGSDIAYPDNIAPSDEMMQFLKMARGSSNYSAAFGGHAFYSRAVGSYTAVMYDVHYTVVIPDYIRYRSSIVGFAAILFAIVILIICITNYFLTRYIINSIEEPLDILNYGVHQIQLGNLNYRIKYERDDEFSPVCDDFNLMAKKLKGSFEAREKDEESRKELIAGISHDLRTPLTSIRAYVEGMLDGIANTPGMQRRYLETVKSKAEDIDHIVDKLFMFSKLDIGEFPFRLERVDIGEEIGSFVAAASEQYAARGLKLNLVQSTKGVYVNIDPVQFRNVLTNILENSVKYKNKDKCIMEIMCCDNEDGIRLSLADNGPGAPEEALPKLFDIFYRNDPSRNNPGGGSGLGLAISERIVERFGGRIWAENVHDGGLKIVITIPKCRQDGDRRAEYIDNRR